MESHPENDMKSTDRPVSKRRKPKKHRLRMGFSTGTAVTAAAQAAMRHLLTGESPRAISVRLPAGYYLPIPVEETQRNGTSAGARVIKDGGDDPDVTHKAEVRARVTCLRSTGTDPTDAAVVSEQSSPGVWLLGGEGVGLVTKAGLPVPIGEPAVNPGPRQMLLAGLTRELLRVDADLITRVVSDERIPNSSHLSDGRVFLPFLEEDSRLAGLSVCLEISVPRGKELARHTLNPRLGIVGGISILGTTGLVKPFSHQAYEETIRVSLAVAHSSRCRTVVLSTGGKSERYAQDALPFLPPEAFVQIADFFAFAVKEAAAAGFEEIVHSVFFGKAVKMAQGHAYTHAHKVSMDLLPLARLALDRGYGAGFSRQIEDANTARHALEILRQEQAWDLVQMVAVQARDRSRKACRPGTRVRLLLSAYDGSLLADIRDEGDKGWA